ncbi:unnamed protein product [Clonostachys rhizophaga]|uniref:BOD1/SHG1 domain-containing protein n=1 Tax=Clonostachys rhizophaga TaxID=160324 RepID=A0A9N9V6J3_9HYPO|nr:unnamed protein product [Clonostachys rhizophaga]
MATVNGDVPASNGTQNEVNGPRKFKASELPLPSATRNAIDVLAHTFKREGDYDTIRRQAWEAFQASDYEKQITKSILEVAEQEVERNPQQLLTLDRRKGAALIDGALERKGIYNTAEGVLGQLIDVGKIEESIRGSRRAQIGDEAAEDERVRGAKTDDEYLADTNARKEGRQKIRDELRRKELEIEEEKRRIAAEERKKIEKEREEAEVQRQKERDERRRKREMEREQREKERDIERETRQRDRDRDRDRDRRDDRTRGRDRQSDGDRDRERSSRLKEKEEVSKEFKEKLSKEENERLEEEALADLLRESSRAARKQHELEVDAALAPPPRRTGPASAINPIRRDSPMHSSSRKASDSGLKVEGKDQKPSGEARTAESRTRRSGRNGSEAVLESETGVNGAVHWLDDIGLDPGQEETRGLMIEQSELHPEARLNDQVPVLLIHDLIGARSPTRELEMLGKPIVTAVEDETVNNPDVFALVRDPEEREHDQERDASQVSLELRPTIMIRATVSVTATETVQLIRIGQGKEAVVETETRPENEIANRTAIVKEIVTMTETGTASEIVIVTAIGTETGTDTEIGIVNETEIRERSSSRPTSAVPRLRIARDNQDLEEWKLEEVKKREKEAKAYLAAQKDAREKGIPFPGIMGDKAGRDDPSAGDRPRVDPDRYVPGGRSDRERRRSRTRSRSRNRDRDHPRDRDRERDRDRDRDRERDRDRDRERERDQRARERDRDRDRERERDRDRDRDRDRERDRDRDKERDRRARRERSLSPRPERRQRSRSRRRTPSRRRSRSRR